MGSAVGWFTMAILGDTHPLMIATVLNFAMAVRNFRKWKAEEED